MDGPLHTYFLGLTFVGYDALWGSMARNGVAQAIGAVKLAGVLPDGNKLRRIYTGVTSIDNMLLSPVVFYDGLMRARNPTYRAMLLSVFSTMQSTSFCMLLTSWKHGGLSKWSLV